MVGGAQAGDEEDVKFGAVGGEAHLESVAEVALPGAGAGAQVNGDHPSDRIVENLGVPAVEG